MKREKDYTISRQILRSGTSIGANIEEAIGGQTKKDFITKLSISYKETRETLYWLRLLHKTDYITKNQADSLINDAEEIMKLLIAILKTSKENL